MVSVNKYALGMKSSYWTPKVRASTRTKSSKLLVNGWLGKWMLAIGARSISSARIR